MFIGGGYDRRGSHHYGPVPRRPGAPKKIALVKMLEGAGFGEHVQAMYELSLARVEAMVGEIAGAMPFAPGGPGFWLHR